MEYYSQTAPRPRIPGRLILGLVIAAFSVISYFSMSSENPVTGEKQHVSLSPQQEIAMGLQASPEMARQFGGPDQDPAAQARVNALGSKAVGAIGKDTPYQFHFSLLADPKTVNAFALPGGQIFITRALYDLLETDGQLAGVLAHEIGHVIERHSSQQMAKAQLTSGLTNAAAVAAYDPDRPGTRNAAMVAALVGQLVNLRYGRGDELQADGWGVKLTSAAGYDPRAMIRVMEILEKASGRGSVEFLSSHPNPGNRIERINEEIASQFPNGLPAGLAK